MAKSTNRTSLREKLQEEFLSCKICLEPFIRPKALPCLHSFCEHCLKDYVRRHPGQRPGYFPCPMCRKSTKIPTGGITEFQDNFLLLSLSDTLEEDNLEAWNLNHSGSFNQSETSFSPPKALAPLTPLEEYLRTFGWYFGKVSRHASEEWLLSPGYPKGTYLIRQGEAAPDTYTLSVRDCDELRGFIVKHYKIYKESNNDVLPALEWYYITPKRQFQSLQELVKHYTESPDGLCCKLVQSCLKPRSLFWAFERGKQDKYATERESVVRIRKLGSGQFAEVWLGSWHNSHQVAIKIQKRNAVTTSAFLDESQILKQLQHPHIIKLLAVSSEMEPIYLLTDYMPNGRLSMYLREGKGKDLSVNTLLCIAAQIAEGMMYMEKEKFVHRNLGARNILVGEENNVKIAGFGMTKVVDDPDFNFRRGLKMAIKWMAPEVLLCNKYSTKADVWSFGIVLVEIFSYGKEPYEDMSSKEAFELVQKGYRIPKPEICPNEVYHANVQSRQHFNRTDCPFFIQLGTTEDGSQLIVRKMNETHDHEIHKALFQFLPRQRQLSGEEKQEAEILMKVQANKKMVQQHMIDKTGKSIVLKNQHNIHHNLKRSKVPSGASELEIPVVHNISTANNGGSVHFITEDNELKALFFRDSNLFLRHDYV